MLFFCFFISVPTVPIANSVLSSFPVSPPQSTPEKRIPDLHPPSPKSHDAGDFLDMYLGDDNSNGSFRPSPPKTAPPAPPGATVCR